tara:strand:- start:5119 stop:6573 length:1455 start_codon:yes stop_codon:yes gene_type:complete
VRSILILLKKSNGLRLTKQILTLVILSLIVVSCDNSPKKTCGSAWVGGEIVNPKVDYVIISHNRNLIDTVPLDENNFFKYKIPQVDPGIYFLRHQEYQAFHLESGDSLMFRVNTIEFDESLTYTGKGAAKNNFLMELFLLNEEIDNLMSSFYNLSPSEFEAKMDSIKDSRYDFYKEFKNGKEAHSKSYDEVVKAAIDYSIYSKKELYISANSKKQVYDESVAIPESFYDFRNNYDLGNESLRNYYPYFRCLGYYTDNLSFDRYKSEAPFDRNSYLHNKYKVEIIDSIITNDSLKNRLARGSVARYLLNAENAENEEKMLSLFEEVSSNTKDIKDIQDLTQATIKLTPGNTIPNLLLLSTENTIKDLHSIIKKPTVIYFWSFNSIKHYKNIHIKANELRSKYPEFDFIGINIDHHFKKWLRIVTNSGYPSNREFQFEDFDDAEKKLLVNSVNKSIILNKDATILDSNTNIFDINLEQQLLGYINK